MKLRTAANLLRAARPLARLTRLCSAAFQLSFLCAAFESGLFDALRDGPMTLDQIAACFAPDAATRDALRSWLDLGVAAKVLGESGGRYRIRSALAKHIADPQNDGAAAFVEEAVIMDTPAVVRMPSLLKRGELFTLSDQMPEVVARSSRIVEPFIFDALEALVPRRGTFRLLDIGCGSGTYLRHAADRNPELRALGAELQPTVAAFGIAHPLPIFVGEVGRIELEVIVTHQPGVVNKNFGLCGAAGHNCHNQKDGDLRSSVDLAPVDHPAAGRAEALHRLELRHHAPQNLHQIPATKLRVACDARTLAGQA